jgi:D-sedoheptulose 7-phosphate isomerase
MKKIIEFEFNEHLKTTKATMDCIYESVESAAQICIDALKNNRKILIFGNGGSAADAQHIAAEFVGRFMLERKSYPAISLTTDSSILTSLGNDYSYDVIFSRQCESLVTKGDIVIGISTSGNSKNIEKGITTSKQRGAITIGLLGNEGGSIINNVDFSIVVNSNSTPHIQEVHRVIYHIICDLVEQRLSK